VRYRPWQRRLMIAGGWLATHVFRIKLTPERQLELERHLAVKTSTSIPSLRRQFQIEMGLPEMNDEEFVRQFIYGE
jgi:hypothetical protein